MKPENDEFVLETMVIMTACSAIASELIRIEKLGYPREKIIKIWDNLNNLSASINEACGIEVKNDQ